MQRYLEVTPATMGTKRPWRLRRGFVSFRGGQAALFVMHFDPRRFHLGYFSLPAARILKTPSSRLPLHVRQLRLRVRRVTWQSRIWLKAFAPSRVLLLQTDSSMYFS